jgi:hypothetical protein
VFISLRIISTDRVVGAGGEGDIFPLFSKVDEGKLFPHLILGKNLEEVEFYAKSRISILNQEV